MKTFLIASAALSLLAAPALAQDASGSVPLAGAVTAKCGYSSSTGPLSTVLIPGDLTDSDGRLVNAAYSVPLAGVWCNGPAEVGMVASQFFNLELGLDPLTATPIPLPPGVPFVNVLDMHLTGGAVAFFGQSSLDSTDLSGALPAPISISEAFLMPDLTSSLTFSLPAGAAATDRPLAGDYLGVVLLVVTPTS